MSGETSHQKLARSLFYRGQPLIVVAGAGASIASGVPTGRRIMEHLVRSLEGLVPTDELSDFLNRATPEQTLELYQQQLGSKRLVLALQELIPTTLSPSPIHRALAGIPASLFVTTNYDSLIEAALMKAGRSCISVTSDSEMKRVPRGAVPVMHLHGVLTQPSTVTWSRSDLDARDKSAMDRYLRVAFSGHSAIFVGMSLSSPDFESLYRSYRGMGRDSEALWIAITNRTTSLERELWTKRGVRQIELPYDELPAFLSIIRDQIETPGEAPMSSSGQRILLVGELPPSTLKKLSQQLSAAGTELVLLDQFSGAIPILNSLLEVSRDVSAAIVVLDGKEEADYRSPSRVRSNLLFELGLLIGRLGPGKVVVVSTGRERLPSDLAGLRYIFIDDPRPARMADSILSWVEEAI